MKPARKSLLESLDRMYDGPARIEGSEGGGPLVALALHGLMISDGFKPAFEGKHRGSVLLPSDWNRRFTNEWIFEYIRPGYASTFILHCSLEPSSGKVFVQGREKDSTTNLQNLGLQMRAKYSKNPLAGTRKGELTLWKSLFLQVGRYIPDQSMLQSDTWQGVLQQEDALVDMMQRYVMQPLLKKAIPAHEASNEQGWIAKLYSSTDREADRQNFVAPSGQIFLLLGTSALLLACLAIYSYKHKTTRS